MKKFIAAAVILVSGISLAEERSITHNWEHKGVESKSGLFLEGKALGECRQIVEQQRLDAKKNFGVDLVINHVRTEGFELHGTKTKGSGLFGNKRSFRAWGTVQCVYDFTVKF